MTSFLNRQAVFAVGVLLALSGCAPTHEAGGATVEPPPEAEAEVELATLMGEMQRHSAKLGYSLEGGNRPLANFYLHEIEEVLGELMEVEEHEGMPIAQPSGVIMVPVIEALEAGLTGEMAWAELGESYRLLIDGCNRCHLATEHGFIEILPATGEPPFNQRFEPKPET